jgi:hypothetical protein
MVIFRQDGAERATAIVVGASNDAQAEDCEVDFLG